MNFQSTSPPDTVFLITAAGSSTRFTGNVKKELISFNGKPLLAWSLCACRESGVIRRVLIVHTPDMEHETREAAAGETDGLEVHFTAGGSTRQESVFLGLEYLAHLELPPSYVLIHDGARPWVSARCIQEVLSTCAEYGGAAPVVPLSDAVKQIDSSSRIAGHCDRNSTFGVQTPQGFVFSGILRAHRLAREQQTSYIDDTEVYGDSGGTVMTIPGEETNRKITYQSDLAFCPSQVPQNASVGHGWDVHRLIPGRPLILGGITIPSDKGEDGHSDGDALLHAVIDGMFGACTLGDIGSHFPPEDSSWKDASSMKLLELAAGKLKDAGAEVLHIDATVVLERPKLRPYIESMRKSIAETLSLPLSAVSVKAKTSEGLPPAGTGDAVEAFAVVSAQFMKGI